MDETALMIRRERALADWNAIEYFRLCSKLGIEPEAKDLSEQGQLEIECENEIRNFFLDSDSKAEDLDSRLEKYKSFYKKGKFLDMKDFQKDVELKAELLENYFPGRFGENGKQPIRFKTDAQKGFLFKMLMEYAEKRANQ